MSMVYRRVDLLLAESMDVELEEGDYVLLEESGVPREGELVVVRSGGAERLCRWGGEKDGEVVGIVVGIRRKL